MDFEDYLMNNSFYSDKKFQPTNFMKNSPSIKALESMLNEKSKSFNYNLNQMTISEEDEEEPRPSSHGNSLSLQSKQNLVTDSTPTNDGKLDGNYMKHDLSPSFNDSTLDERLTNVTEDNDDTLIDDHSAYGNGINNPGHGGGKKYVKMPSLVPPDLKDRRKSMIEISEFDFDFPHQNINLSTPNLSTPNLSTPKQFSIPQFKTPTQSTPTQNTPTQNTPGQKTPTQKTPIQKTPTLNNVNEMNFSTPKLLTPSPRKSPHIRSSSMINLKPESPGHKRSNTVGDLSEFKDDKKRFSFMSLFKKKPKDNDKKKDNKKDKKDKQREKTKGKDNVFNKNLNSNNNNSNNNNHDNNNNVGINEAKPVKMEDKRGKEEEMNYKMTKSFKSNTNVNFIREVTESPFLHNNVEMDANLDSKPVKLVNNVYDNEISLESSPNEAAQQNPRTQSTTDSVPTSASASVSVSQPQQQSNPKPKPQSESVNQGIKQLQPSPLPLNDSNESVPKIKSNNPFHNFNPSDSERINYSDNDIFASPKKESLIGDSIFPKTLNAQEVESIISLERSRSVKSIKSNKRTSFVNYDGSDENIIVFSNSMGSLSPISNVSRSNSILKNRNINASYNDDSFSRPQSMVGSTIGSKSGSKSGSRPSSEILTNLKDDEEDDFNDLIEFSDFIDLDNLEFDVNVEQQSPSPLPSTVDDMNHPPTIESPVQTELVNQSMDQIHRSDKSMDTIDKSIQIIRDTSDTYDNYDFNEKEDSPIIISSSSSSSSSIEETIEPIRPLNIKPQPLTSQSPQFKKPEVTVTQQNFESPKFNNSPVLNKNGNNSNNNYNSNNRLSGLKGPSFKNSPISTASRNQYSDDCGVGSGFGSDDEDDDDFDSEFDDEFEDEFDDEYDDEYDDESFAFNNQENKSERELEFQREMEIQRQRQYELEMERQRSKRYSSVPPNFQPPSINSTPKSSSSPGSRFTPSLKDTNMLKTCIKPNTKVRAGVKFSSRIILYETYNCDEYDRHPDTATCNQITPILAQQIRDEVYELKSNWIVHKDSICNNHFL